MRLGQFVVALIGGALMAGAALCQDEGWTVVHSDPHSVISVRRPVGEAPAPGSIWVRGEYSPKARLNGFKYASERYLAQVDCAEGKIYRSQWRQFSGPGLTGKTRPAAADSAVAWLIVPDTVDEWVAQAVCAKGTKGIP